MKKLAHSILDHNNFPVFLALVVGIVSTPLLVSSVYSPQQTEIQAAVPKKEQAYRKCLEQVDFIKPR